MTMIDDDDDDDDLDTSDINHVSSAELYSSSPMNKSF